MLNPGDRVYTKKEIRTLNSSIGPGSAVEIIDRHDNGKYIEYAVRYIVVGVPADELESEPFERGVTNNAL